MSQQQQFQPISFVNLGDYTPWEGAAHGMVSHEGVYRVQIVSATPTWSQSKDKAFWVINQTVLDEDEENKGVPLISRVHFYGKGKADKKTGIPYNMAKQAADLLVAVGFVQDAQIRQAAAAGGQTDMDPTAIGNALVGRVVGVKISFDVFEGALKSDIDSYLTAEVYEKLASTPSMRRGAKASAELLKERLAAAANSAGLGGASLLPPVGATAFGPVGATAFSLGGPAAAGAPAVPAGAQAGAPAAANGLGAGGLPSAFRLG